MNKYVVNSKTGCWEWQRAIKSNGYGTLWCGGKMVYAHRHYYEKHRGAIPTGMQLDHLCRNRGCINPNHLEAVTPGENCRRGVKAKLSHEEVEEIRLWLQVDGVTQVDIAKAYGMDSSSISDIARGESWSI